MQPYCPVAAVRILLVKLKHIGDALLLTPTIQAMRQLYPTAEIWVIVRQGTEDILVGCPAIDRLMTTSPPEARNRNLKSWMSDLHVAATILTTSFDYAFELSDGDRGRILTSFSFAKVRCTSDAVRPLNWFWRKCFTHRCSHLWTEGHSVEKDYQTVTYALPLPTEVPSLIFDGLANVESSIQDNIYGAYVVLHPGTRWKRKQWPLDRWIELGRFLAQRVKSVIISTGPDPKEAEFARKLASAIGEAGITTQGRLSWSQLAALMRGAVLFVGVDTAAMHLAAACQCPTVAIFGESDPRAWHPWKVRHELIRPSVDTTAVSPEKLILEVTLEQVIAGCTDLLADPAVATSRSLPHPIVNRPTFS